MAIHVEFTPDRTYANRNTLEAALRNCPRVAENPDLRYLIMTTPTGRVYPVFLGEKAIQAGVHFLFCVAG